MKNVFALVDCNNFYVSCERLFRPELQGKPVIVLSNNDGCVIARSNEVKALGVSMGTPFFKIEKLIKTHKIYVFSSNYTLYGDLSSRVMEILQQFEEKIEIYSIDEAFLSIPKSSRQSLIDYGRFLKNRVEQCVGIPVTIGLGRTKTLAKAATSIAKKNPAHDGVLALSDVGHEDNFLALIDVKDVWGIGRQYAQKLKNHGIDNALQLKNADDSWVREKITICGLRTVMELRGCSCLPLERVSPAHKSIVSSRSFGQSVCELAELKEAVATHVSIAAEKLRRQGLVAGAIQVFFSTNKFNKKLPQYAQSILSKLPQPSSHTPTLLKSASRDLERIYRPGYQYKKAGVMLTQLSGERYRQQNLLYGGESENLTLMKTVDLINRKYGRDTVQFASSGTKRSWGMKQSHKSPAYTTCWQELPVVSAIDVIDNLSV